MQPSSMCWIAGPCFSHFNRTDLWHHFPNSPHALKVAKAQPCQIAKAQTLCVYKDSSSQRLYRHALYLKVEFVIKELRKRILSERMVGKEGFSTHTCQFHSFLLITSCPIILQVLGRDLAQCPWTPLDSVTISSPTSPDVTGKTGLDEGYAGLSLGVNHKACYKMLTLSLPTGLLSSKTSW